MTAEPLDLTTPELGRWHGASLADEVRRLLDAAHAGEVQARTVLERRLLRRIEAALFVFEQTCDLLVDGDPTVMLPE